MVMRLLSALGLCGALLVSAGGAHAAAPLPAAVPADTTVRVGFSVPSQPLTGALADFARQADLRVQVAFAASWPARSEAISGSYTAPDALRRLLAGTGLSARFLDGETVLIAPDAASGAEIPTHSALVVVGQRSRAYAATRTTTATRTDTPLRDTPQAVSVVTNRVVADQAMQGMADVVRYVPGISMGQGEGHRDAPTIRGNSSTADFFVDGLRDDAQYFRDLYNVERVEALKGPNAMIFGRGGGGGVINRVTKDAQWAPTREVTLAGGSYDHRRATLDLGQGLGSAVAGRVTGVWEDSRGFRDAAELRRYGVNPTVAVALGSRTTLRGGFEYFSDERTVDRGVPSFQGRPLETDRSTFFGNPDLSFSTMEARSAGLTLEHATPGGLTLRNRARWASYDKFYQNSFAGGAVNAAGVLVNLSAYNNATDRANLLNQTDLTYAARTGALRHTLLLGAELGRQETENFRETGYYDGTATSSPVAVLDPTVGTSITFRQSASDADNRSTATVAAAYVQDQVELSAHWQLVAGLRFDRFAVDFHNNRTDQELDRTDDLVSPRAGLVFKPVEAASLYGSYTVSYLPSSGDQFSSLSATTETLEPERFANVELGAKWDVLTGLSLTVAGYRLDRSNSAAPDPADATRTIQTGSQRTEGVELGAAGNLTADWEIVGGAAFQRAEITRTTAAAAAGKRVALVPERTLSLWNRYQLFPALGVGVGVVHQTEMYAAIDNSVTLPGFTRADGALFLRLGPLLSAQVNVENLFDELYYGTSHGNNNIMPGAPRTVRVSVTTRR